MKRIKIIATTTMLLAALSGLAQQAQIKGEIKGLGDSELSIRYTQDGEPKSSTVKASNDKFVWSASISEPQQIMLRTSKGVVSLYIEPANMILTGTLDSISKAKLTGSGIQTEAEVYNQMLAPYTSKEMPMIQKYARASKAEQAELAKELREIADKKNAILNAYIGQHPESALSLILVTDLGKMGSYQQIQDAYKKLGGKNMATPGGKRLAERLEILKRSEIGMPMSNFTQNDIDGQPVNFSAFKGKYVLIDFWASWCAPCRAENPNVLKAYDAYKDKGFTVIGISLDDNAERWKKAIKEDGMPWTQLSDLKGAKNEVATYYGIKGIPSNLLIDSQGKIIAKDLIGEGLAKRLEEIFGKHSK